MPAPQATEAAGEPLDGIPRPGMFGSRRVGVNPRRRRLPQPVEGAWPALGGSGRKQLSVADIAPPIGSEPKRVCAHLFLLLFAQGVARGARSCWLRLQRPRLALPGGRRGRTMALLASMLARMRAPK